MLTRRKLSYVKEVMAEAGIDLWLTFSAETALGGDPIVRDLLGCDVIGSTGIVVGKDDLVIAADYDADGPRSEGWEVVTYTTDMTKVLRDTVLGQKPRKVAVNVSDKFVVASGLRASELHFLERLLPEFAGKWASAEEAVVALRGTLLPEELEKVRGAVRATHEIYDKARDAMVPGATERDIAKRFADLVRERGLVTAWGESHCPIVAVGKGTGGSEHAPPSDRELQRGDLVVVDFGVRFEGYSSDVMRTFYLPAKKGEVPPAKYQTAFKTVMQAMDAAFEALKPGAVGNDVDNAAKRIIQNAGFQPVHFCTGHPLGRYDHEIGALLGPDTPRYRGVTKMTVKRHAAYAVEPIAKVPGKFRVGVEENVFVTEAGVSLLTDRQTELIILE